MQGYRKPHPVTIRGVTYPSINAAARELGLSVNGVWRANKVGRLDQIGSMGNRKPVTVRGVRYETMGEAARALGVSRDTMRRSYKNGTLDFVGTGNSRARTEAAVAHFRKERGHD